MFLDYVGVEARGFMFGPSIALGIGAKFVPLRKPRKLPGMPIFMLKLKLDIIAAYYVERSFNTGKYNFG